MIDVCSIYRALAVKLLNLYNFLGRQGRAWAYAQAVYRWSGLPHYWRGPEDPLRAMGWDRRRCRHEGPQDQTVAWLWLHYLLSCAHGRWRPECPTPQVRHFIVYSQNNSTKRKNKWIHDVQCGHMPRSESPTLYENGKHILKVKSYRRTTLKLSTCTCFMYFHKFQHNGNDIFSQ